MSNPNIIPETYIVARRSNALTGVVQHNEVSEENATPPGTVAVLWDGSEEPTLEVADELTVARQGYSGLTVVIDD